MTNIVIIASSSFLIVLISIYIGRNKMKMIQQMKDGTAQGVAKIRHYESLHKPNQRLFYDPYAKYMYPGSFAQTWLGTNGCEYLYNYLFKGLLEMLIIRTKWIDEQILLATSTGSTTSSPGAAAQLIILGAGYDTRGFRLDFQAKQQQQQQDDDEKMYIYEVDQPDVQKKKIKNLKRIANNDKNIQSKMKSMVQFVSVDFTSNESIEEKLQNAKHYDKTKQTIIVMEGVTQYIPKSSTSDTLIKIKSIVPKGSILLISYVDKNSYNLINDDASSDDNNNNIGPINDVKKIINFSQIMGEPWISSWNKNNFKSFLNELSYEVINDVSNKDLYHKYMIPLEKEGRMGIIKNNHDILAIERYVIAKII